MSNHAFGTQILLVEDDPGDVAVAPRAFRRHRLERKVEVAPDGHRALGFLRAVERGERPVPQVVFLDLRLPDLDGLQIVRTLRASTRLRHVPVVMISSSRDDRDIQASYRAGANSFIVKRFQSQSPGEYLVDVARYWLDLNEGPR